MHCLILQLLLLAVQRQAEAVLAEGMCDYIDVTNSDSTEDWTMDLCLSSIEQINRVIVVIEMLVGEMRQIK